MVCGAGELTGMLLQSEGEREMLERSDVGKIFAGPAEEKAIAEGRAREELGSRRHYKNEKLIMNS